MSMRLVQWLPMKLTGTTIILPVTPFHSMRQQEGLF
jgi:hypothetical protein